MPTLAEAAVRRLSEWGVEQIFGYSGDGLDGLLEALDSEDAPELVQCRHGATAAFAATAFGKFDGRPGVLVAASEPEVFLLLSGLYDAKRDGSPVVAIVGRRSASTPVTGLQPDIDLRTLFEDVASAYITEVTRPSQVPAAVDRACRTAAAERTVTCLVLAGEGRTTEHGRPAEDTGEEGAPARPPTATATPAGGAAAPSMVHADPGEALHTAKSHAAAAAS